MVAPSPASKTARPILTAGYAALALYMQESAISHGDIATRLRNALEESYRGTGYWCYYIDAFGDESGDVIYYCEGGMKKAPYTCSANGATIDTAKAVSVVPLTTYETEAGQVQEAGRRNSSRDLKQLQAIHDSAVGLGAACSTKEAATALQYVARGGAIKVAESSPFSVDIPLKEAFEPGFKIKLIAPGKGSTAFYTEEMLKRDGPNVFKAGTPMRIDHPTSAQEAERPEGSVRDWGAVLALDAYWLDTHPKGPGLYSEVKPFSDHVLTISEKGPYAGVSISAWGEPLKENGKVVMREGVPVLARLTGADGVDMVTRAGAGGMFLTEAARTANPNEGGADDMDAAELKKLQESLALREANEKKLLDRALRGDAREFITTTLRGVTLHEAGKELVLESVMRGEIPQKDGMLDEAKLKESIDAEAKRIGIAFAAATSSGRVQGLGAPAPTPIDVKEFEHKKFEGENRYKESVQSFMDMGMPKAAAERAAKRGVGEVA